MAATVRKPAMMSQDIRCTNCGAAIEISRAADHICRTATSGAIHPMDRFNQALSSMKTKTNAPFPFDIRPKPTAPTNVDVAAANRPIQPSPLAPPSAPPTIHRHFSPMPSSPRAPPSGVERTVTPGPFAPPASRSGAASPFQIPPRAATASPRAPLRPPSPDRPLPQECAFPPFPLHRKGDLSARRTPEPSRSGTSSTRKGPDQPRPKSPPHILGLPAGLRPPDPEEESRPETPEQHVLGLPPGLRPAVDNHNSVGTRSESTYSHRTPESSPRSRAETPSDSGSMPPNPPYSERRKLSSHGRPETMRLPFTSSPHEEPDKDQHSSPDPSPEPPSGSPKRSLGHFRKPSMSAAIRPLHEIGCIKTHRATLSRSGSQHRLGHELGAPFSAKVVNERSDARLENAPPVPAARFLQEHAIRNDSDAHVSETHSPTASVSSNGSSALTNSSRSSPPTSAVSLGPSQKPFESVVPRPYETDLLRSPDTNSGRRTAGFKANPPPPLSIQNGGPRDHVPLPFSACSAPNLDVPAPPSPRQEQASMGNPLQLAFDESTRSATAQDFRPPVRSPLQLEFEKQRVPQQTEFNETVPDEQEPDRTQDAPSKRVPRRRPVKSFSRPNYSRAAGMVEPESPMDPALHNGRLPTLNVDTSPPPPQSQWEAPPQTAPLPAPRPDWAPPPLRSPQTAPPLHRTGGSFSREAFPPRNQSISRQQRFHTPAMHQPDQSLQRTPTTRRSPCRGCGQLIHGKSVSSADGQLSGRWHRPCFVCKTCSAPFASSDFYVFDDQPYCARHYHQLNQTLCQNCDRGIEGPYVETDDRAKFHPHCFTCRHCHLILKDVHFEDPATGAILCERHAMDLWRAQFGDVGLTPGSGGGSRFPERRTTKLMMV